MQNDKILYKQIIGSLKNISLGVLVFIHTKSNHINTDNNS